MRPFLLAVLTLAPACTSSTAPGPDEVLEPITLPSDQLPAVTGTALSGETWSLPADLEGKVSVLLLGYVQEAQFDADRWAQGLIHAQTPAKILEVPTVKGLIPALISDRIDGGMREGIPSEDWASVVTVYGGDAAKLVEFTGDRSPRNMRVLLLDKTGKIRWFHDRGFSASKVLELDAAVRALQ